MAASGKKIGHKASKDPLLCPKEDILWRILHMISHAPPLCTALYCVMTKAGRWENITPTMISKTPKTPVGFYGPNLGFEAEDVSA